MAAFLKGARFALTAKSTLCGVRRMSASSDGSLIETKQHGNIFSIGINCPEKRNSVDSKTADELENAFNEFEKTEDYFVAVLHGKGGHFSAGLDLKEVATYPSDDDLPQKTNAARGRGPMGPTRMLFSKPVIAAVSGYSVAGGMELALMCDMRIMEESAIFGIFCRRFGVPLIDGGTVRLPQLIGLSRALDVILTGRPVKAQEALHMGLANKVVPDGQGFAEAMKLAETLCTFPQECMRRDRLSAYNSCFNSASFDESIEFEWENARHVINKEATHGAASFVRGVGRGGSFDSFQPKNK